MNTKWYKFLLLAASICANAAVFAQAVKSIDAPYISPGAKNAASAPVLGSDTTALDAAIGAKAVHYIVTRADDNFRLTLARWSKTAGWEFAPEHWAAPRDIPITGAADFGMDFKSAVRGLLRASELADMPVQPCFYSNSVLRVIPINELCARSTGSNTNVSTAAN